MPTATGGEGAALVGGEMETGEASLDPNPSLGPLNAMFLTILTPPPWFIPPTTFGLMMMLPCE